MDRHVRTLETYANTTVSGLNHLGGTLSGCMVTNNRRLTNAEQASNINHALISTNQKEIYNLTKIELLTDTYIYYTHAAGQFLVHAKDVREGAVKLSQRQLPGKRPMSRWFSIC